MATKPARRRYLFITEHMEALSLSDETVADRLGVARGTVWRWRKEQWRLDPEKLGLLAGAMGLDPRELWQPPNRPSLDVLLKEAPDELHQTAADIVRRLVKRG